MKIGKCENFCTQFRLRKNISVYLRHERGVVMGKKFNFPKGGMSVLIKDQFSFPTVFHSTIIASLCLARKSKSCDVLE